MRNKRTTSQSSFRPPRSPLSQRAKRLLVGVAIALVVSMAATGTILAASRGGPPPLTTKQQKQAAYATQMAQALLTPDATKGPPVLPPHPAQRPIGLKSPTIWLRPPRASMASKFT